MASTKNGPVGLMYKMKPYNSVNNVTDNSTIMYKMKEYYKTAEESSSPVEDLERRQEEVLKRLTGLQEKVAHLEMKYNVPSALTASSSSISSTSVTQSSKPSVLPAGKLHDVVINIDPSSVPYSLLVLYQQLSQHFKVLATTHVHSSVSSVPDNIKNLFQNGPVQARKDYQIGLTVIWKKVKYGPELMVDPSKQTLIQGETNIARYLQRLVDSNYDLTDPVQATQIDDWLDTAQLQYINGSNKEKAAVLRSLNSGLGKADWLVGNRCSLADIVMWSALHQAGQVDNVPSNVKKWLTACNASNLFSGALQNVQ